MAWLGGRRLRVDTDISSAVPQGDIAFSSARTVLQRHPSMDRVVIDLAMRDGRAEPDALIRAADVLVARLEKSGLFSSVGTADAARGMTSLYTSTSARLPALFSAEQLQEQVAPRLTPEAVEERLGALASDIAELSGIGTAARIADDPLGLSELALARLGALIPNEQARIEKGHIVQADGKHLLVTAMPRNAMMDTEQAHAIDELLRTVAGEFEQAQTPAPGAEVALTAVGGFRAAIDNETMVKRDTNIALWVATFGIGLLLLLCFPRPWLGLFALLPAIAGGCMALFVYSFLESDISVLALGFGGALVSITVDQGAVYLLFVDRQARTEGHRAAHEVFSIGSLSTLINIGSFLALRFSGFDLLGQLGLFAALGIGCSYLFVHVVFPHIFPSVPPARRAAWLPIDRWLARVTVGRGFGALAVAAVVFVVAAALARPTFNVDIAAMNTVRAETARDEGKVSAVWGDLFRRVYVMVDAADAADFQAQSDRWLQVLEQQQQEGVLQRGFSASMLNPGRQIAERNTQAWKSFWTAERIASVQQQLRRGAETFGFAEDAFDRFLQQVKNPAVSEVAFTEGAMALYGVSPGRDGKGLVWLGNVVPGPSYEPGAFARSAAQAGFHVFDGVHFSSTLADFLARSFGRMLLIIVCFVSVCVLLFFLDLRVAALAMSPLVFAFVCTMGTLRVIGHPIDVTGLMLAILIFGMGVDYSFSFVRVYQRSLSEEHASHGPVRTSVFLASSATLIGMITLTGAQHAVARSAGTTATIAVAFCALGAFVILPPLLRRIYAPRRTAPPDPANPARWVRARFARLSAWPRMFARLKLRLDPMFPRLAELVPDRGTILDIGCGFGIPAAWLLARSERARVVAVEPDEDRSRIAQWVLGERGAVHEGPAPESIPPVQADTVLMLDVVHHFDDEALARSLERVRESLATGGRLVLRATVPSGPRFKWERWLEAQRVAFSGRKARFRSVQELEGALERAGLRTVQVEPSAAGREETWLVAERAEPA
jgi:predicted exporter